MSQGRLLVHVTTANEMMPIQGARVLTMDKSGHIVSDLTTDSNGMTGYIDLVAPDPALTLRPETAMQGFANYNVVVMHPNFQQVTVHNVEIIGGRISYLPVNMRPATQPRFLGDPATTHNIYIPRRSERLEG